LLKLVHGVAQHIILVHEVAQHIIARAQQPNLSLSASSHARARVLTESSEAWLRPLTLSPSLFRPPRTPSFPPLISLKPGLSLNSHALACASLFGIPSRVLDRASDVSVALARCDLAALVAAPLDADERAQLQHGERVGRRLLEWDLLGPGTGTTGALVDNKGDPADNDDDGDVDREAVIRKLGQVIGWSSGVEGEDEDQEERGL
jgi:hypothetical protein